jgi:hypothetical protein
MLPEGYDGMRDYLLQSTNVTVAVWCRSFDNSMCSKGDKLLVQEEQMSFAK